MPYSKPLALIVFIISITLPYISVFVLGRTSFSFLVLPISYFCLAALIASSIALYLKAREDLSKLIIVLVSILSVFIFFFSYNNLVLSADRLYYSSKADELNDLVTEIKSYGKIHRLSASSNPNMFLNNSSIEMDPYKVREGKGMHSLEKALADENVSLEKYKEFSKKLNEIDIKSFNTMDDGTMYFHTDWGGFAYIGNSTAVYKTSMGWHEVGENWYIWYNGQ